MYRAVFFFGGFLGGGGGAVVLLLSPMLPRHAYCAVVLLLVIVVLPGLERARAQDRKLPAVVGWVGGPPCNCCVIQFHEVQFVIWMLLGLTGPGEEESTTSIVVDLSYIMYPPRDREGK